MPKGSVRFEGSKFHRRGRVASTTPKTKENRVSETSFATLGAAGRRTAAATAGEGYDGTVPSILLPLLPSPTSPFCHPPPTPPTRPPPSLSFHLCYTPPFSLKVFLAPSLLSPPPPILFPLPCTLLRTKKAAWKIVEKKGRYIIYLSPPAPAVVSALLQPASPTAGGCSRGPRVGRPRLPCKRAG